MNQRLQWVWAAALLLSPLVASAQPAPTSADSPAPPRKAVATSVVAAPAPEDDDVMMWFDDLFGPGDEFATEGPGEGALAFEATDAPDGHDGPQAMAWDDEGGGDGQRHEHRIVVNGRGGRGMMMRRGFGMRFAALDLTDTQRDKLRDIHEAAARKNVQRRADMQLAHMDLAKLMRAETPSASAVNAQIDKLARLQSDGMKAHFDTFMQARAILTPEQLKKLHSGPPMDRQHEGHGGE